MSDRREMEAALEAILFVTAEPVPRSRLLEVFDGAAAPAVAAYNAGEAQAGLWLEFCGEGCTEELYLLNITFTATRNYTAQVLAAAAAYQELYPEPAVSERSGSAPDVRASRPASDRFRR